MASTAKVIAFSSPTQHIPAVERITQDELVSLIQARNALATLSDYVASREAGICRRLEAGADVEPGVHVADLKENFRRTVAWKEVVMRLAERLGHDPDNYCSSVLVHTKPTRTVSLIVN